MRASAPRRRSDADAHRASSASRQTQSHVPSREASRRHCQTWAPCATSSCYAHRRGDRCPATMRTQRFTVSLMVPSRERKVRKHTHTHTHKYPIHLSHPPRASPDIASSAPHAARTARDRRRPRIPRPRATSTSLRRVTAPSATRETRARERAPYVTKHIVRARRVSIADVPCSRRGAARKGGSRRRDRGVEAWARKTLTPKP